MEKCVAWDHFHPFSAFKLCVSCKPKLPHFVGRLDRDTWWTSFLVGSSGHLVNHSGLFWYKSYTTDIFFSQPGHMSAIYQEIWKHIEVPNGGFLEYGYPKPVVSRSNIFQGCCTKPMTCRSPCPSQRGQQLTLMSAKPGLDCWDQKTLGYRLPTDKNKAFAALFIQ
jgi:hypothetical protein